MGSISDAAGPLLEALQSAAKSGETEFRGDPSVIAAVRLGWVMKEIAHGWSLEPLPQDLSLDEIEKCQAQALQISQLLNKLDLPGLHWRAVDTVVDALQHGPAKRAARELERHIIVALTGAGARFARAYMLGAGLRALAHGGRSSERQRQDREIRALVGALDALSSELPSHAARAVANSLTDWWQSQDTEVTALADAQVNLWREVIVGEKKGTELLEPDDYLAAAKKLEAKFVRRALSSKWLVAAIVAAVVLFGLGVYLLFVAQGHAGKVAAGAAGVLAGLGLTWKGIGGTLGKLVSRLEVPLWGAELDGAITEAITITKASGRGPPPAPGGLSYADRRGRAISQIPRRAGSLPFPDRPAGTADEGMPFDHLVVVMMENHSFDNLLGALRRSRSDVDGLRFAGAGKALNSNPGAPGMAHEVSAFPLPNTAQAKHLSQSWKATHEQIHGGRMDGFVRSVNNEEPMGYYPPEVLPFAYSLASSFTLANRWFCSLPGPTYPNRRFLLAGTAYGGTVTDFRALLDHEPPNGTIFDRLSDHHIRWHDYFTDVPATAMIPSIVLKHADHHRHIAKFFEDCRTGDLPEVSFVDAGVGVLTSIARGIEKLPAAVKDALRLLGVKLDELPPAETEEDPQDMYYGEAWAHQVVEAILHSPAWSRTLLIYTYDEHGGYYDHVAPPPAIAPDDIPPKLAAGDPPGAYDVYGPRVPAVVASPYSRPGGVTDIVHDHTSVLATIEHKWNLPALTNRDANAATVMDFLDLGNAALLTPPVIEGPSPTGPSGPSEPAP